MNDQLNSKPYPSITDLLAYEKHISDVKFDSSGRLYFLSSNDGVGEVYRIDPDGESEKISGSFNVRGSVAYGGGGFDIKDGKLVICERDGSIHAIDLNKAGNHAEIVPAFARTCSPKISPDGRWSLFIYSQNEVDGIGISAMHGLSWPRQLVLGTDFYMHPTWHPDGEIVAWAEWDHPDMPWDSSRVKIGQVGGMQLRLFEEKYVDGERGASANQPSFSPDGRWLSYIKRNGNWDILYMYDIETGEKKAIVAGEGFHLRMPDWIQGLHSYAWSPDSRSIYFIKYHNGSASLSKVDITTGSISAIDTSGFSWLSQIAVNPENENTALLASTFSEANMVLNIAHGTNVQIQTQKESRKNRLPAPQAITFENQDGDKGYGWYFAPISGDKNGAPPPCLVKIHSGPTSLKHAGYSSETEYFTSRGFAVAYLNYRGSVSFGYDYQYALAQKWGQAEVEDTLDLLDALSNRGFIDREHIAVLGSSAGGFSVLQILANYPGMFKAAICSYAVSDLVDDAEHTHKFEKYYHRFLTGNYPQEKEKFIERSPISHIEKIQDPVALFHGSEDRVVSATQSQKIFDELSKRGVPCTLKIFAGEGHGFRKLENIEAYYQDMTAFLNKYI